MFRSLISQILKVCQPTTNSLRAGFWRSVLKIRLRLRKKLWNTRRSDSNKIEFAGLPILLINLDHRADRLRNATVFFEKIEANRFERISAVQTIDGRLGCIASHLQALNIAIARQYEAVMICEDDIELVAPPEQVSATVKEFMLSSELDVLCLSFNLRSPSVPFSDILSLTTDTQTASCYLVKRSAFHVLQARFSKSLVKVAGGKSPLRYMHDMYWKRDQKRSLIFAHPPDRAVKQSRSYSDLEQKIVDYGV